MEAISTICLAGGSFKIIGTTPCFFQARASSRIGSGITPEPGQNSDTLASALAFCKAEMTELSTVRSAVYGGHR